MPDSPADRAAHRVAEAYAEGRGRFAEITARARGRWERREWREGQADARERLARYPQTVERCVEAVWALLGDAPDPAMGAQMKQRFTALTASRADGELAETFFNSVIRRVFAVVGVNPRVEYTDSSAPVAEAEPIHRTYPTAEVTPELLEAILADLGLGELWADRERDARLAAAAVRGQLAASGASGTVRAVEVLPFLFFRNKGAYLVGRLCHEDGILSPLVLAILHTERGVEVDAVLTSEDETSIVFGFTRSYFHVRTEHPRSTVAFLRSILPRKRLDELYTSIGFNKHGKTELYRGLMRHLHGEDVRFEPAEGTPGMVMSVFALPSFNIVFKIIRDRFGYTKDTSRRAVMRRYQLVFAHDRVGRLADAQEFEQLRFPRACFPAALLEQLLADAPSAVQTDGDRVVIHHLYTERRVRPLDVYLEAATEQAARAAVLEYGVAIRDLAAANIFPGDLLLKNFGVTRHGRVIFYDYDELALLGECRFRSLPQARHPDDEMRAEPWFSVGPNDVFPEEFVNFLIPRGPLRELFLEAHGELFQPRFWRQMQEWQERGEVVDFFPYRPERRLQAHR